jgi:hypothetical protein
VVKLAGKSRTSNAPSTNVAAATINEEDIPEKSCNKFGRVKASAKVITTSCLQMDGF